MKIERINENQIRCTLTREDLASRKIKLSELAYGSEKAKALFRDMMMEASREVGFEADNIPLMIEAIPVSPDSIVLIITKVEDPDELDSRFSRFSAEDVRSHSGSEPVSTDTLSGLDDILDLISRISKGRKRDQQTDEQDNQDLSGSQSAPSVQAQSAAASGKDPDEIFRLTRFFLFRDLETVIKASKMVEDTDRGTSSLFKNPEDNNYYLIIRKEDLSPEQFNRVCNILSEYGISVDYMNGMEEFFLEHMDTILHGQALQTLRTL